MNPVYPHCARAVVIEVIFAKTGLIFFEDCNHILSLKTMRSEQCLLRVPVKRHRVETSIRRFPDGLQPGKISGVAIIPMPIF
jgi:hypothetical protein